MLLDPLTGAEGHAAAAATGLFFQQALVRKVVVNHPLAPELGGRVEIEHSAAPAVIRLPRRWRCGIEADPTAAGKIHLHPGVRVTGADHVTGSEVVKVATAESVHNTRGNAQGTQHDRHG